MTNPLEPTEKQLNLPLHEGLPVAGYRPQPEWTVSMVNSNKREEEKILQKLDLLADNPDVDKRWLAIGRTELEKAFMSINRAIFRPSRVKLD
jgi:hypothetical protein